ncbi:MAG: hypothetical protein L0210_10985 [Rhodospirillales bacterium]|nr:hypothetical protein [Rhodospirillales bacterium]
MIEISIPAWRRDKADDLTKELRRLGVFELRAQRQSKDATGAKFFLSEPGQGCACSLLSEDADWDLPIHRLDPGKCEGLERTLRIVAQRAGASGFALEAAWLDGAWATRAKSDRVRMRMEALLQDIRQARLRNGAIYEIVA